MMLLLLYTSFVDHSVTKLPKSENEKNEILIPSLHKMIVSPHVKCRK